MVRKEEILIPQFLNPTRIAVVEVVEWKVLVSGYFSLCTWETTSTYALSNPIPLTSTCIVAGGAENEKLVGIQ